MVHQLLFISFTAISIFRVSSTSLIEFPLEIDPGNWIINAIITDEITNHQTIEREYISAGNIIRGKLDLEQGGKKLTMHYSNKEPYFRDYFTQGDYSICTRFKYLNNYWDTKWAFAANSYISEILTLGPSLLFRLKNKISSLTRDIDDEVRGVLHHGYNTYFYGWQITFFIKADSRNDEEIVDISKSSRVIFKYDIDDRNIRMDIYSIERTSQELDSIVTIRPGTFCANYLTAGLTYDNHLNPTVIYSRISYISLETILSDKDKLVQKEVYTDENLQLTKVKSTIRQRNLPVETMEMIYDYNLGVVYELKPKDEPEKCKIIPMDLSAPGLAMNSEGKWAFKIFRLFDLDGSYTYLGPVNYGHEYTDGAKTEAWQRHEFNSKIDQKHYDLVVTTQYYAHLNTTFSQYEFHPMGITYYSYNKTEENYSALVDFKRVDYQILKVDFESLENILRIDDCYPILGLQKTLILHFLCKGINCKNSIRSNHKKFNQSLKEAISSMGTISASRISRIELLVDSNDTKAFVTFSESPHISNAFTKKMVKISKESIASGTQYNAKNYADCLIYKANSAESFEAIAYCEREGQNICEHFRKFEDILEDTNTGIPCEVATIPLQNIYQYSRETPLIDIEKKLSLNRLTFKVIDGSISLEYELQNVIDVSMIEKKIEPIFYKTYQSYKLRTDSDAVISVPSSSDFSSCYSLCAHSNAIDCLSFSFCRYNDKTECLLSSPLIVPVNLEPDKDCQTNVLNILNRYTKIESRKFIEPTSIAFETLLTNCAQVCSDSDQCKSFQYCPGSSSCTIGNYYTDSSTDSSEYCDIFIPKVINKFRMTGKHIVADTFHTEFGVNVDQCAALCHDWSDEGGRTCESFNYCREEENKMSLCQLSKYSIENVTNEAVKFAKDNCRNYRFIRRKEQSEDSVTTFQRSKDYKSGMLFIIFSFVVFGLIMGFIANIAYVKLKLRNPKGRSISSTFDRNTFSWTRQLNDDRQSTFKETTQTQNSEEDEV